MLSRVAERMYWAGRYLERAENTARLVMVHGHMLLDLPAKAGRTWEQLVTIFEGHPLFRTYYDEPTEQNVVNFLVADTNNFGSVLASLNHLRENIRTTRDIVPTEGWQCVNELYLFAQRELPQSGLERARHDILSQVISRCQELTGLLAGTMSHGPGYHFMRLGRNLERMDMTSRVLDVPAASLIHAAEELESYRYTLWMHVLKSVSAYQMYCQYVRRRVIGADVINFLLRDTLFPRSLRRSLGEVSVALQELPRHKAALGELGLLSDELDSFQSTDMDAGSLHEFLDTLQTRLDRVHRHITRSWFLPVVKQ